MSEKYSMSNSEQLERRSMDAESDLLAKLDLREALVRLERVRKKTGSEYHDFLSAVFQALVEGKGNPLIAKKMLEQMDALLTDQNAPDDPSKRLFLQKMGDLAKTTVGVYVASQLIPLESALGMIHTAQIKIENLKKWIDTCEITDAGAGLPEFKFTFIAGDDSKGENPIKGEHFDVKKPIEILLDKRGNPTSLKIGDANHPISFDKAFQPISLESNPLAEEQKDQIQRKAQYLDLWKQKYPDARRVGDTRKNIAIIERHNVQMPFGEWGMPSESGTISERQGAVEFSPDSGTLLHFSPQSREQLTFSYEGETYLFHQDCYIEEATAESTPFARRKSDEEIVKNFTNQAEISRWIADMVKKDSNFSLDQYDLVNPSPKLLIKRSSDNRIIKEFKTSKDWKSYRERNAKHFTSIITSSFTFQPKGPEKNVFHIDLIPLQDKNQSQIVVNKIYDITEELAKKAIGSSVINEFYGGIQLSPDDPQYKFLAEKAQRYFQPVVKIEQ